MEKSQLAIGTLPMEYPMPLKKFLKNFKKFSQTNFWVKIRSEQRIPRFFAERIQIDASGIGEGASEAENALFSGGAIDSNGKMERCKMVII